MAKKTSASGAEYEQPDEVSPEEADEPPESGPGEEDDHLAVCGRAIREALTSGDDRAIGSAVRDAIKTYSGSVDDEDADSGDQDEDEGAGSRPNLAMLLVGKGKKKE